MQPIVSDTEGRRDLELSMANEQVDITRFLFEDRRLAGEASGAYANHADFQEWYIGIYPEDRAEIKRAGYAIAIDQDTQAVIPVVLDESGRRIRRIILKDGSGRDIRRHNEAREALQIVNVGVPATNPDGPVAPLVFPEPEPTPVPVRKASDDGGGGAGQGRARLYAKITHVMGEVGAIGERGQHGQGYSYATDGDMFNAVRTRMAAANLAMLPPRLLSQRKEGTDTYIDLEFTLADGDTGETLVTPWFSKLQSNNDKAIHAAMTMCVKYFLKYTFLISTEGDEDADKSDGKPKVNRTSQPHNPTPPAQPVPAPKPAPVVEPASDIPSELFQRLMKDKDVMTASKAPQERANTIHKMWAAGEIKAGMDDADTFLAVIERLQSHRNGGGK